MVVINQQFEDDNCGFGRSSSSIDEIARVNASNEAEIERVMIHLYTAYFKEDGNHGAGGSTSSIDELARVSVSTKAEMERVMNRILEETICPMILADFNAKQQKFISLIREKFGVDLLTSITCNFDNTTSNSGSQTLQLQFLNGISTPVSTGMSIEGKDHKPFVVALVDVISGEIVTTGAGAGMEVEIVVLEGHCNDDEAQNWNSDEFNHKIVRDWNEKKVLQGNTFLNLKEGIVCVDNISFTQNSTWKGNRNFRLGAKSADAAIATRVKEATTESFLVRDKRSRLYEKHQTPSVFDHVYRLYMISRRSDCFDRLKKASIKTVMDLRTFHAINPERLKDILDVHPNKWKIIMNHAQTCKDDDGIYLYYHPRDGQKSNGVVFNIYGKLVGLIAESKFVPSSKLPYDTKAEAEKLVLSSSEHWEEVVSFNNEASLMSNLHKGSTLSSLRNGLNVVIPCTTDTHDHTSPQVTSQSQSPKRPASEHAISNSPKKPRDSHPVTSPGTSTNLIEDDEYLQYLNLLQSDRWKTLWCVVGWISIFSKVRKRRTTFCHQMLQTLENESVFVVAASIEPAHN